MMKKALTILIAALVLVACNSSDTKSESADKTAQQAEGMKALKDSANFTTIQWIDTIRRNLGKITEGEQLEVSYRFKNTGTKALVVANVSASCGCTIPEVPKEPFAPGTEGLIKAKFNSANRVGMNHKEIFVAMNTVAGTSQVLEFTVEVVAKK